MAQLVIAAAGAAIGGSLVPGVIGFGITGAQAGWIVGSMVGSAFAPAQKSQGPRLSDLSVSSSAYGTPIPYTQASPRVAGQIIWASTKREIATTTRQGGKGGQKQKVTTYTYEVDLLIMLTDNVIGGVSRIWSNGKLVYNMLASASAGTNAASYSTSLWSRLSVYTGGASQLPDPTYEAAVGTANAPAYRGRGTVFIESLQLGSGGQIPNLTFELFGSGAILTSARQPWEDDQYTWLLMHGEGTSGSSSIVDSSSNNRAITVNGGVRIDEAQEIVGSASINHAYSGAGYLSVNMNGLQLGGDFCIEMWARHTSNVVLFYIDSSCYLYNNVFRVNNVNAISIDTTPGTLDWHHYRINRSGATIRAWLDGVLQGSYSFSGNIDCSTIQFGRFAPNNNLYFDGHTDEIRISSIPRDLVDFTPNPAYPYSTITPATLSLADSVAALCLRAGLAADQFDVTALASITLPIRSMAISQVSSVRSVLDMLASAYFFDIVLSDKLYFRPRGAASVATIQYEELGVTGGSAGAEDPLPLTQSAELEVPAQIALTYSNVDNDHQTDTQSSDRLISGQESTSAVQLPLGFTATEAKQIVDRMLANQAWRLRSTVSVDMARLALEVADPITLVGDDGSQYRVRIERRTEAAGVLTLEVVIDDATVLTQLGYTSAATGQDDVAAVPSTTFELLDIPLLSDAENSPGVYVAVSGANALWTIAGLYTSQNGVDYVVQDTLNTQTAIGTCTTTLGAWAGFDVFDEVNSVTVSVLNGQTLESFSRDAILAGAADGYMVGSELIYARTATLVSPGVYTLSGLLRGRRGTDWAMASHAAAERFVCLPSTGEGVLFLPLSAAQLGALLYLKAVTAGQLLTAVTAKSATLAGVNLKPFSPVDVRVDRAGSDHTITWQRRTRLQTRITGALPMYAPLGEEAESYEVEVFASEANATAGTPVVRTIAASQQSCVYTSAQRTSDGTGSSVLYLRVYQRSALVGRGTPRIVTI